MNGYIPKLIDGNHYLLWTDALHSRQLARQASNKWDKAAYVRWTILLSWTVLEIACQDALEEPSISYSFKRNIDKSIQEKGLNQIKWGEGVWQKVIQLQDLRKNIVHRFANESNLFPDKDIANFAITVSRNAVREIYSHCSKQIPVWINDDSDSGWSGSAYGSSPSFSDSVTSTVVKKDAQGVENPLKVFFTSNGTESLSDVLAPNYDPEPYIKNLLNNSNVPISEIKVLRGEETVFHKQYNIRGT